MRSFQNLPVAPNLSSREKWGRVFAPGNMEGRGRGHCTALMMKNNGKRSLIIHLGTAPKCRKQPAHW